MKKTIITISSIFFIFLTWIIIHLFVNNPLLFPDPLTAIKAFLSIFQAKETYIAFGHTLLRLIISLIGSFILGILLGFLAAKKQAIDIFLKPVITIIRALPVLSIIVLALIIFGFAGTPYVITFMTIFPLVYQAIYDAVSNIDSTYLDIYKLENNHPISGFFYCYLPLIRGSILTVLFQCLGLGIKVILMAEYISQIKNGVGKEIFQAVVNLRYDLVLAWTLLVLLVVLTLEFVAKLIQGRITKLD